MSQDDFLKIRSPRNIDNFLKVFLQKVPDGYKIHYTNLQYPEQQKKSTTPLEEEVHLMSDRQLALESRVESLEFKSNIASIQDKITKIEDFTNKVFSDIPIIVNASYRPSSSGLIILLIHNSDDVSSAIDQIQKGIFKLEEAFPNIYFEPWVLHVTEVQNQHLKQSKTIFQR
ncbi:MAG: hypothetical protein K8Q88_00405 [Nitrosarchaeum sp.]|nr:hypothetical protein [Nitrosarchaeum sp.]